LFFKRLKFLYLLPFSLFHLFTPFSHSAFEFKGGGSRPIGMGETFTGLADDLNAVYYNPAGLRLLDGPEFSSSHTRLFSIDELKYTIVSAAIPTKALGAFAFTFDQFGPNNFEETQLIFSHAFHMGSGMLFGSNIRLLDLDIGGNFGFGNATAFDFGVFANVHPKATFGFSAVNIFDARLNGVPEDLYQAIRLGGSLKPFPGLIAAADIEKPIDQTVRLHGGMEIELAKNVVWRIGVQNRPSRFSTGGGFAIGLITFDYALLSHAILPTQHQGSVTFKFGSAPAPRRSRASTTCKEAPLYDILHARNRPT